MTNPTIVTLAQFRDPLGVALAGLGVDATIRAVAGEDVPEIADLVAEADVLLSGVFRASWLTGRPGPARLRLIQAVGAGVDGIELAGLPTGITVCNVYGHEYGIAEHVFMVMAALNRDLFGADARLRRGEWGQGALRELRGRTLCLAGLGRIGREVARWGRFYGMRVTGVTRTPERVDATALGLAALGGLGDLAVVAADCDVLVNSLPHTPETTGLIDARVLGALRPSAYVVNVGRGPVIDEWALYDALVGGRLAGAAIDVWYHYPDVEGAIVEPADAPFRDLPNVILTPHQAGYTEGTMRHRWAAIAENVRRVMAGEELENVVWPTRG